jgi:hypothetical protein
MNNIMSIELINPVEFDYLHFIIIFYVFFNNIWCIKKLIFFIYNVIINN